MQYNNIKTSARYIEQVDTYSNIPTRHFPYLYKNSQEYALNERKLLPRSPSPYSTTQNHLIPLSKIDTSSAASQEDNSFYTSLETELYNELNNIHLTNKSTGYYLPNTDYIFSLGHSTDSIMKNSTERPLKVNDAYNIFELNYTGGENNQIPPNSRNDDKQEAYLSNLLATNFTTIDNAALGDSYINVNGTLSSPANFTDEFWHNARWWGLIAVLVLLLTVVGNILVILAISWERRLQNMTNYFLMSLAATDLMVAVLVMPFAIVELTIGRFPFSSEWCLIWISLDVLFCTASIMHLCTISVDRFLSLGYPMKFGRNKTCRRVLLKLVLVWCLSLACSLPLSLMYAADSKSTIVHGSCQIPTSLFQIIGSVICFYIPLVIMVVTYALTVRLLSVQKMQLMNGPSNSVNTSKVSKTGRLKKILFKEHSSITDTAEATCDVLAIESEMAVRSTSRPTSRESSPLRRTKGINYHSPQIPRVAHLRARNYSPSSSKQNDDSSLELTVFPRCSDREHSSSPVITYSLSKSSLSSEFNSNQSTTTGNQNYNSEEVHLTPGIEKRAHSCRDRHHRKPTDNRFVDRGIDRSHEENLDKIERESKSEGDISIAGSRTGDSTDLNGTPVSIPCSCAPRFFLEGFEREGSPANEDSTTSAQQDAGVTQSGRRAFPGVHSSLRPSASNESSNTSWTRCSPCCGGGSYDGEMSSLESPWQEEQPRRLLTAEIVARIIHKSSVPVSQLVRKADLRNSTGNSTHTSNTNTNTNTTPVRHSQSYAGTHQHSPSPLRGNATSGADTLANSPNMSHSSTSKLLWRTRSCTAALRSSSSKRHGRNLRMEQKATKVLGVVFFTFVVLWSPFFIINVLMAVCPSCSRNIGDDVFGLVTWLGYVSSTVNPFFYTFFNKTFRETFWKIVCCKMKVFRKYHK